MRIRYFIFFLLFAFTLSAQESHNYRNPGTNDISEIKLYPNPAFGGTVNIITTADTDKKITVYDVFGEVVLRDMISGKALDISRLVAGVYVIQVNEGQHTMTRKLVVK